MFQGTTFSEIAALLAIISILGGALAWLIRQHSMAVFLTKRAYYAQRDDDEKKSKEQVRELKEARDKQDAETKGHREAVLAQVAEMNKNLSEFMLKLAEWKSEFHTRLALLEDRQKRTGGRRTTDR